MTWFSKLDEVVKKYNPAEGIQEKAADLSGKVWSPLGKAGHWGDDHPGEVGAAVGAVFGGAALLGGGAAGGGGGGGGAAAEAGGGTAMGSAAGELGAVDSSAASSSLGLTASDVGGSGAVGSGGASGAGANSWQQYAKKYGNLGRGQQQQQPAMSDDPEMQQQDWDGASHALQRNQLGQRAQVLRQMIAQLRQQRPY